MAIAEGQHRGSQLPPSAPLDSAEGPVIIPAVFLVLVIVIFAMAAYGVTYSRTVYDYSVAATAGTSPTDVAGQLRTNVFVPSLMFFTLGGAALVAIGAFLWSLRKRSERVAAKKVMTS